MSPAAPTSFPYPTSLDVFRCDAPQRVATVAGGITTLTVADVKLRAENISINVKTDPQGILSDSMTWVAPQGNVGDKFSLVVHASTGGYDTNVHYHFEYMCD